MALIETAALYNGCKEIVNILIMNDFFLREHDAFAEHGQIIFATPSYTTTDNRRPLTTACSFKNNCHKAV